MPKTPLPMWQRYTVVALFAFALGATAMLLLTSDDNACPFCGASREHFWNNERGVFYRGYACGTLRATSSVSGCSWSRSGVCVKRGGEDCSAVGEDKVKMPKPSASP